MRPEECPSWEGCSAPLCPLAPHPDSRWFPDEEICHSRFFRTLPFVKVQIQIIRRKLNLIYYFTIEMLTTIKYITSSLKGCDPDSKHDSPEFWINRRKPKQRVQRKSGI